MTLHPNTWICTGSGLFGEGCHHHRFVFTHSFWSHQSGFYDQRQKQSFFAANLLGFWWKNKQGYIQKNQILNVKYGTGSVMILDAIKSQNIWNACFCHEAKIGLMMDLLAGIWSKTLHPNPHKLVRWPKNENFDMNIENVRCAEDDSPQKRTLKDLVLDSLLCRGSLRSAFCKTEYISSAAQRQGGDKAKS